MCLVLYIEDPPLNNVTYEGSGTGEVVRVDDSARRGYSLLFYFSIFFFLGRGKGERMESGFKEGDRKYRKGMENMVKPEQVDIRRKKKGEKGK